MDEKQTHETQNADERRDDELSEEDALILDLIEDIEQLESLISPEAHKIGSDLRPITVTDDVYEEIEEEKSFGDKLADEIAVRAGSWGFIITFAVFMVIWISLNIILASKAFDPYPFILLNLGLSTLAALQAPVILMSQNRQAEIDRAVAQNDYQVNLKAELEIADLHHKVDALMIALEHQNKVLENLLSTNAQSGDTKESPATGK